VHEEPLTHAVRQLQWQMPGRVTAGAVSRACPVANMILGETPARKGGSTRPSAIDDRRLIGCAQRIERQLNWAERLVVAVARIVTPTGSSNNGHLSQKRHRLHVHAVAQQSCRYSLLGARRNQR
jgi:hypothetical protein